MRERGGGRRRGESRRRGGGKGVEMSKGGERVGG